MSTPSKNPPISRNHFWYNYPLPDALRRTTILSSTEKLVLLYLYDIDNQSYTPNIIDLDEIAEEIGFTKNNKILRRGIKNLIEKGFIATEVIKKEEYFTCFFDHDIYKGGDEDGN